MTTVGNSYPVLILMRSDPQDRLSKDGVTIGVCGHPSRLASLAPQAEVLWR
jgi:hypothetical protein